MAQTAKRNLTQPQPTPCARLPRSSPRHESPASPPKTRPLHQGEGASHTDIHEAQLHLASTAATDQVHDPRYRRERRTISRSKAGGRKPMSRIMSDISAEEGEPTFRETTRMDRTDELQQPAPLASHCWTLPATRKSRPALLLLSNPSSLTADDGKTAPEHRMQKSARLVVSQDVHGELAAARRANYRRTRLPSRARARRSYQFVPAGAATPTATPARSSAAVVAIASALLAAIRALSQWRRLDHAAG
jgi:hypothetical protein